MAKKDNTTKFYCYAHRTADTGHIFYIGKGHGNRAYSKQRSKYWHNKANKHGYTVEIIASKLTECQAFDMEREFIAFYGRENLVNLSDGGEGATGRVVSDYEKEVKRKLFSGKPLKEETKKKLSESAKGRIISQETKDKISKAIKGRIVSEETKEKMRNNNAMKNNPEARRKLSEAKKGKPNLKISGINNHMHRPEMKKLVSDRCKGVPRLDMIGSKNPSARAVICIETGALFETQKSAVKWLISIGKPKTTMPGNISSAASGKLKTAYGFHWKYADK